MSLCQITTDGRFAGLSGRNRPELVVDFAGIYTSLGMTANRAGLADYEAALRRLSSLALRIFLTRFNR
jgi:hypothetical protein